METKKFYFNFLSNFNIDKYIIKHMNNQFYYFKILLFIFNLKLLN